jgi:hypothetical protein
MGERQPEWCRTLETFVAEELLWLDPRRWRMGHPQTQG